MAEVLEGLSQIHPEASISLNETHYLCLGKLAQDATQLITEMHNTIVEMRKPTDVHRH